MSAEPRTLLKYLQGDTATPLDTGLVITAAFLGGAVVFLGSGEAVLRFGLVSRIVLAVISADLFGGAVGNFTRSTNGWYWRGAFRLRIAFLAVHAFQPAAIALFICPEAWPLLLASYFWMAAAGILIVGIRGRELQLPAAAFLTLAGSTGIVALFEPPDFLVWFVPVYLMKLNLAFSVNHWEAANAQDRRP